MRYTLILFLIFMCAFGYCQTAEEDFDQYMIEIKKLDSLIVIDPSAENYYFRGFYRFNIGDRKNAFPDLNKSVELNPEKFDTRLIRGRLRDENNDHIGAIEDFTKCITLDPSSSKGYLHRGYSRAKARDYQGAISDFETCLSINPEKADAYYNMALAKQELGKHKEASSDLSSAIALDPDLIEAYSARGISKSMSGDKSALMDFNHVIKHQPKNPNGYFNRAMYFLNNKSGDYCSDLKKSIELGMGSALEIRNEVCR